MPKQATLFKFFTKSPGRNKSISQETRKNTVKLKGDGELRIQILTPYMLILYVYKSNLQERADIGEAFLEIIRTYEEHLFSSSRPSRYLPHFRWYLKKMWFMVSCLDCFVFSAGCIHIQFCVLRFFRPSVINVDIYRIWDWKSR